MYFLCVFSDFSTSVKFQIKPSHFTFVSFSLKVSKKKKPFGILKQRWNVFYSLITEMKWLTDMACFEISCAQVSLLWKITVFKSCIRSGENNFSENCWQRAFSKKKSLLWRDKRLPFFGPSFDCASLSVCFAVWKNRHMRTVTNYFIVNLSLADVLVTIICLPASLIVDITETWFFGNTLCKIVPYLQVRVEPGHMQDTQMFDVFHKQFAGFTNALFLHFPSWYSWGQKAPTFFISPRMCTQWDLWCYSKAIYCLRRHCCSTTLEIWVQKRRSYLILLITLIYIYIEKVNWSHAVPCT